MNSRRSRTIESIRRRGLARRRFPAILACCLAAACGCMSEQGRDSTTNRPPAERPAKPQLTAAERSAQYDDAFQQGVRLASRGKYGLALGAFEEAASLDPDSFDAWFNVAACHEQLGDPYRAIAMYRRLLSIREGNPDADCYANIGTCCIKLYYREKNSRWRTMAIDAWKESLALRSDQPVIQRYLAAALSESDE